MSQRETGRDNTQGRARTINRRNFLKGTLAVGTCLVAAQILAGTDKAQAQSDSSSKDRFAMMTDLRRCVGCRRCEEACNKANGLPEPEVPFTDKSVFEEKRRPTTGAYTVVNRYYEEQWIEGPVYRKVQCNHCLEPACVSSCLVAAMKKTPEGPVTYDPNVCIGCRYCLNACPFYIPAYEYSNALSPKVRKCFMCYENRLKLNEFPACSVECPVEAITFGRRDQLIDLGRKRIMDAPGKYVNHIYGEKEAGGLGWLYLSGVPFEKLDFPTDLPETAYPEFSKSFLTFVPLILVIWPTLLGGIHLFSRRRQLDAGTRPLDSGHEGKP